ARDTINVTVIFVNDPPVISAIPGLNFDEDKSLLYPIPNWYPFVTDKDHADSTLAFAVVAGRKVSASKNGNNFLFSAPANWFGKDTLQLTVTDPGKLANTTALLVTVNPVNDAPTITGLPDSLVFKKGSSVQLKLWDHVEDVETLDRQLTYSFLTSNSLLLKSFDHTTGVLVLTAPQFHGRAQLFINASDTKAGAQDTVAVRVELPTGVASPRKAGLPTAFQLWPNSPNPFNPGTTIHFDTPHAGRVKLAVYTLRGELVQTLVDGELAAGAHQIRFDGRNLASGIYFYRMETGSYIMTRKMLLQK
ncbi:MAG: Ig-like domain-containing protein, partial [bacterium]